MKKPIELIARIHNKVVAGICPLVFTTSVCLGIQESRHAKAVNTNLGNQLKRGNFAIALSYIMRLRIPQIP